MERLFLDTNKNIIRLSQNEFEDAKEIGDWIQYCYANRDEIQAGGGAVEQMTKRASCIIKDRDTIKVLAKTIFDGVIEDPKLAKYHASMAANMIENTKVSPKLPNPNQIMKDQLLDSIRSVERFVKINLNKQKTKIISQVIGIVSLIAHLYNKSLVDGEIIFNWIVNVLVSSDNKFVRNTMLAIISDKIRNLVENEKADSVTLAVDKIIKEELREVDEENVDDKKEEIEVEEESMQLIDESNGPSIDYIEWFQQTIGSENPNLSILNYQNFTNQEKLNFAMAFIRFFIQNQHLIPKLALFCENFLRTKDKQFLSDLYVAHSEIIKEEKSISFIIAMDKLATELCFNDLEMSDKFLRFSLYHQTTNENAAKIEMEVGFLLKVKRLGEKVKRVDKKLYEECLNYIKGLYDKTISKFKDDDCDLFNLKDVPKIKINPSFERMIVQINNSQTIDINFILKNPALHAKYLFLNACDNTEKHTNFAKAIQKLGRHLHHKIIKQMIVALCEENFDNQNVIPNESEIPGITNLLKFIAELFNLDVIESKTVINILSTLSENNSVYSIYAFAMITREKVEKNEEPEFAIFKEFLLDVTKQRIEDIKEIKGKPHCDIKPDQKFVLFLQQIIEATSGVENFDTSIIKNPESLAHVAKVLICRTIRSQKLMENFSNIFKTIQRHSKDFEDAFCYTVMLRTSELIKIVRKQKNLRIKNSWRHVENTGKLIAILYNENLVDFLPRMFFKLLMEIKQECKGEEAVDHEGFHVMLKLFMEVKEKFKNEQFEIFLQLMDIVYEIKESQKHSKNLNELLKFKNEILNNFKAENPLDLDGGSVNPSMRLVIFLMTNLKTYDHIQYSVDVIDAKEAASCYYFHAVKHFFDTKEFIEFLITWSKIDTKTKERSRFLPEIVNLCMRNFIEQHVQKKENLNPVRVIATSRFTAQLFLGKIIQEKIYMKFIEMAAENFSENLNELNFRCFDAILKAAEIKRLKNCEKYFKLREIIFSRERKIYRSEIDDKNFVEVNMPGNHPQNSPKYSLEVVFDDILGRAKVHNFFSLQPHFKKCEELARSNENFKSIFRTKFDDYFFILTKIPQVKKFNWEKLTKLGIFLGYFISFCNQTDPKGENLEILLKTLHQQSDELNFAKLLLRIIENHGFPSGSFYVSIIDQMFLKADNSSNEYKNTVKEILKSHDKLTNLKVKSDQVSPSLKALIHGIITQNDYSDVLTINNIKVSAGFYFDNAILYPLSHLEGFVSHLSIANEIARGLKGGQRKLCSELWKIIVDLITLCEEHFFKLELRQDIGVTKLAALMYTSGFYPPDKFFNFLDKIVEGVASSPTHVTLLRYKYSALLVTPEMLTRYPNYREFKRVRNSEIIQRRLKYKTDNFKTDEDLENDGEYIERSAKELSHPKYNDFLEGLAEFNGWSDKAQKSSKEQENQENIQSELKKKRKRNRNKKKNDKVEESLLEASQINSKTLEPKNDEEISQRELKSPETLNTSENQITPKVQVSKYYQSYFKKEIEKIDELLTFNQNLSTSFEYSNILKIFIAECFYYNDSQLSDKFKLLKIESEKDLFDLTKIYLEEVLVGNYPLKFYAKFTLKLDALCENQNFSHNLYILMLKLLWDFLEVDGEILEFYLSERKLNDEKNQTQKRFKNQKLNNTKSKSDLTFRNQFKNDPKTQLKDSQILKPKQKLMKINLNDKKTFENLNQEPQNEFLENHLKNHPKSLFEFFVELIYVKFPCDYKISHDQEISEFCLIFKQFVKKSLNFPNLLNFLNEILEKVSNKLIDSAFPHEIDEILEALKSQKSSKYLVCSCFIAKMTKQLEIIKSNLKTLKFYRDRDQTFPSDTFLKVFTSKLVDFVINFKLDDIQKFTQFLIVKIYKEKSEKIVKVCLKKFQTLMSTENSLPKLLKLFEFLISLYNNRAAKLSDFDEIFNFLINENLKILKYFLEILHQKINSETLNFYFEAIESKIWLCSGKELKLFKDILEINQKNEKLVEIENNLKTVKVKIELANVKNAHEVQEFIKFILKHEILENV